MTQVGRIPTAASRGPVRFLTNHASVLCWIAFHPDCTVSEIAGMAGISHRRTQSIVGELTDGGYVTRAKSGRRNTYTVVLDQLLHPQHDDSRVRVRDLLDMVPLDHPWRHPSARASERDGFR